jgi:hypothetical protein
LKSGRSRGSDPNHTEQRGIHNEDAEVPDKKFLGHLAPVAAQFGDQRNHAGVDAGHQPFRVLAFVVPGEQPVGTPRQIGHVGAPLVEEQIQAGAEAVPALFERLEPGFAAADF